MTDSGRNLTRTALLLGVSAALAVTALAGCASQDPQQVQITDSAKVSTGISPLERGVVRRESLDAAKKGMNAWLANDVEGMKPYWDKTYIDYYTKLYAKYAKEGKVRHRKLAAVTEYDVTDMNSTGTEVLVDIYFTNANYTTDKAGKVIEKPANKQTQIQLTVNKRKGGWVISRMISGNDVIQ